MGGVFRVEDTALGRQVALKVIGIADSSGEFGARLLREAKIIAQLEHPGIVPVHDVGTLPDGRVFYTMKLVQGRRLDHYRDELASLPERLRIFQKICEAVGFAHAHHVLHRDLKPQNIMVGKFGEVLVMDWGLAKFLHAEISAESNPRRRFGRNHRRFLRTLPRRTLRMARFSALRAICRPSRRGGDIAAVGPRADVFSLGAVLGFLLESCGRVPKALARDRKQGEGGRCTAEVWIGGGVGQRYRALSGWIAGQRLSGRSADEGVAMGGQEQRMDSADCRVSGDAGFVYFVAGTIGRNSDCRFRLVISDRNAEERDSLKIYNLKLEIPRP